MTLSNALIGELRVILQEEYGADVSEAEAVEIGTNLVRYFSLLGKIGNRDATASIEHEQLPDAGAGGRESMPPTPRGTGPP